MAPEHQGGARLRQTEPGRYALEGALVHDTVVALLRDSERLMDGAGALRVDLAGVTHADSAGIALVVEWLRAARGRGGALALSGIPGQMLAIADASGLGDALRAMASD